MYKKVNSKLWNVHTTRTVTNNTASTLQRAVGKRGMPHKPFLADDLPQHYQQTNRMENGIGWYRWNQMESNRMEWIRENRKNQDTTK